MRNCGRWRIRVNGTVQGVGFRPFVYRTASEAGLSGHVCNTGDGVAIEIQGTADSRDRFLSHLRDDLPPLARIQELSVEEIEPMETSGFSIIPSRQEGSADTQISPDVAPCDDCLRELLDPADRRHRYPFINCTNCGPRYTIIEALPYDRPKTTMKAFTMCPSCAREYADPRDRRFHAQPDACAACGPQLRFVRWYAGTLVRSSEPLKDAIDALCRGEIVAIKGIGGFHLACDAMNDAAVAELRRRKRRDEKPFAVMVADLDAARELCHCSGAEAALLASPERPIVLLRRRDVCSIAPSIAPGNRHLGLMLPSSPLHHLLFFHNHRTSIPAYQRTALVMTSANVTDEPIAFTNEDAIERLRGIADAFLLHDREIRTRVDDSIARVMGDRPVLIRRARGFVPAPVRLSFEMPQILAAGADLKGAICLSRGPNAYLSQHLGDLENVLAHRAFEDAVVHLQELLGIKPQIIACDLHPDYFSTRFAHTYQRTSVPAYGIQHHHAHIAACMAENDLPNEKVIGIALDGTGFGPDGTIWGGEVLIADYAGYERAARFRPVPMPGGDAAAREPWRMALAYLSPLLGKEGMGEVDLPHLSSPYKGEGHSRIDPGKIRTVIQMIEKGVNCPMTSSCGRLFDAVAALIGLRMINTFEGQAAMELEQIADEREEGWYRFEIQTRDTGPARHGGVAGGRETRDFTPDLEIDFAPLISDILGDIRRDVPAGIIAARFHNTIVEALVGACASARSDSRFTLHASRVCLSGGCFQNALLTARLKKRLEAEGFSVYTHSLVPPNDGGIALGQAVIAAHRRN